eukprot:jgi/Chlat1/6742/Chrsp50S06477
MTSPSADKDLLMLCASRSCSPSLPLFFRRSLPAKSTKLSFPLTWHHIKVFSSAWLSSTCLLTR